MRFLITTGGSRGDVQPYIALGAGLRRAGHEVTVASHRVFEDMIRHQDLGFHPVAGDPGATTGALVRGGGGGFYRTMRRFRRVTGPLIEAQLRDYAAAAKGADGILYTLLGLGGYAVAKELGLARIGASVSPAIWPSRWFPSCMAPPLPVGGRLGQLYNLASYSGVQGLMWRAIRNPYRAALREIFGPGAELDGNQIRGLAADDEPCVYGWSPSVLPEPPEWGGQRIVTGYWFLDSSDRYEPPADLVGFLEAGSPPVCVSFSSLPEAEPARLTRTIVSALKAAGERGILLSGSAGIGGVGLPDNVYQTEEAPHDWLFPRCSAVVHHGGAGTTGAALRAGVPSIVIPSYGDQPFWAALVAQLGVGPDPLSRGKLDDRMLGEAIRHGARDPEMRNRARSFALEIQNEDGVTHAVRAVEHLLEQPGGYGRRDLGAAAHVSDFGGS